MTREEAIRLLSGLMFKDKLKEALAMAIKALDQEPTTKNNLGVDCVARQDVERFIEGFINEYTPEEELEFINLELDGLKHLPPATPQEPRKGHWIGIDEDPHEDWECDNCGFVIWADENIEKFHYCPICGAKMVEPQESEG